LRRALRQKKNNKSAQNRNRSVFFRTICIKLPRSLVFEIGDADAGALAEIPGGTAAHRSKRSSPAKKSNWNYQKEQKRTLRNRKEHIYFFCRGLPSRIKHHPSKSKPIKVNQTKSNHEIEDARD
jgi:hypothetical protein